MSMSEDLSHEQVKRYAEWELVLIQAVSSMVDPDSGPQATHDAAQKLTEYLGDPGFLVWLTSQYAVIYKELMETKSVDCKDDLANRALFAMTVQQQPEQFQKSVDEWNENG